METNIELMTRHPVDYDALLRGEYSEEQETALLEREDFESIIAAAEILSVLHRSKAMEFIENENGNTIIVSPSLRRAGLQVTYFDDLGPIRHSAAHDPVDVAKELAERFSEKPPVKVMALDLERGEPMQYINSSYISPNGSKMEDGLNAIGDRWTLERAEAALMDAGFVHIYGDVTDRRIKVNDDKFLTQGQIVTIQNAILESMKAGADVVIEARDGRSTSLLEENTWKIAQITGYLVNNGDFAYGDYDGERARAERHELEESLRRSDRCAARQQER